MLKNVLNNVISVLVLEQRVNAGEELVQDGGRLLNCTVLQDALDDAAAVGVSGQVEDLKKVHI